MSTSLRISTGSDPPNSITTFFKYFPAIEAIDFPALVLPVKETPLINLFDIMDSVYSFVLKICTNSLFKNPASLNSSSNAIPIIGVLWELLCKIEFPVDIIGTKLLKVNQNGKLNGTI